jgi:tetratricopeptide (TPR) repeat protein
MEALSHLQRAHDAFREDDNLDGIAEAANDVGVLYTVLRRYGEAEAWLREAQRRFVELEDYDGEAQTLGNLGSMYQSKGDLKEAAANLQLAADRFHLDGNNEQRSSTLKVLSLVRLRQFRFLQAVAAYEAALACHPHPTVFHRLLRRLFGLVQRLV